MRISPYLCGEAIDAFVEAASRRRIPVRAAGLEGLDQRWAELAQRGRGLPAGAGVPIHILVGDIAASNNVAFTEAYRKRKLGVIELWIVGKDDEVARRVATRLEPDLTAALHAAVSAGRPVEVLVNPEEAPAGTLDALLLARGRVAIQLLWNGRNTGYLVSKIGLTAAGNPAASGRAAARPDLFLDVGVDEPTNGVRRVLWGRSPKGQALFLPLPADLWIKGRSHPTGMDPVLDGRIDAGALAAAGVIA